MVVRMGMPPVHGWDAWRAWAVAAGLAVSGAEVAAQAAEAPVSTAPAARHLGSVVITATTREQPVQDVQASVQVITAQDLQAFAGTSVTEALKMASGVDARPNGSNAFVAVRGMISNAGSPVLILVDGMRRTGKYGGVGLNLMGVEDVERVEIVRGPMSALYGADATGGVINIITKAPKPGEAFHGSARLSTGAMSGGQRRTNILGATLYGGTEQTGHRLALEQRSKGLFRYPSTASTTYDLSKVDESYFNYEGAWALAPGHELRWSLEHVDQDDTGPAFRATAPVGAFTAFERERRRTAALRYKGVVGPGLLNVDLADGRSTASTTRSFPTIETTAYDQRQLDARYTLDLEDHTVVAGVGTRREELNVSIVPTLARTTNHHLLLQDEWKFAKAWKLLAGVRHDDFSTFGSATTPRVSLAYAPGPWSYRIGYGEAFRAPSALEQYSRFTRGRFLILGQPTIQPESNKSWEVAAAWSGERASMEWVLFQSNVTNLIQTTNSAALPGDPAGVTTRSIYSNIGKARLRGSELAGQWRVTGAWTLTGGWDHLEAIDAITGARLTQRARNTYRVGSRWTDGAWRVDVQGRYLKGYYASVAVTPPTPTPAPVNTNFGTLDVKVSYALNKAWNLAVGIDNLTNRRQPANYSATGSVQDPPGRFLYLTASARF